MDLFIITWTAPPDSYFCLLCYNFMVIMKSPDHHCWGGWPKPTAGMENSIESKNVPDGKNWNSKPVLPILRIYIRYCLVLSRVQLFCDSMDCSAPGSSVHGISQTRMLEWVAISFSGDLPEPGIEPRSPELADGFFTTEPSGKPQSLYRYRLWH